MSDILHCQETDLKELFDIFKSVYKFNPLMRKRDYFDWQFKDTPFNKDGKYTFLILRENGEIKSFLGYVPVEFICGDKILSGCWTYNWYSANKDGSGLKLLSWIMEKYDNIFLIGYSKHSEPIFRLYEMYMADLPRWIGIIDPSKTLDILGLTDNVAKERIKESYWRLADIGSDTSGIYPCNRFDNREEFIFDKFKGVNFYIRRTCAYLNWRYIDIPYHDYKIIRGGNNQFAVYRIEKIKGLDESVVRIMEWNFVGYDSRKAMAFIIKEAERHSAILVDFFCSTDIIASELEAMGFLRESSFLFQIPFLFRPINYKKTIGIAISIAPTRQYKNLRMNEWYITKGDSDIDRFKL